MQAAPARPTSGEGGSLKEQLRQAAAEAVSRQRAQHKVQQQRPADQAPAAPAAAKEQRVPQAAAPAPNAAQQPRSGSDDDLEGFDPSQFDWDQWLGEEEECSGDAEAAHGEATAAGTAAAEPLPAVAAGEAALESSGHKHRKQKKEKRKK